jgi:anaerobic selenocysteine-containing dehydrogenase
MLYHPDRLTAPLVRAGPRGADQWETATPEAAVSRVSEHLQSLRAGGRPEALALVAGYSAGTMRDLWHQFMSSFGSPNHVTDEYDDGTDAVMGLMHGIRRRPSYDLDRARLVLSFGAPLFESWWSPLQAFVAFASPDDDGATRPRFIQVDTRFSRTAARAHEWVGVRPGTHAVLALGISYVLIRDELFDADFVARHVSGFEDFVDAKGQFRAGYRSLVTSNYRTEEVSAITGVPVERITSLARAFAATDRPAVAVCGTDVTFAPNGLLAGLAVHSLNVLTGNINRPGGVLFGDDAPIKPLPPPVLDDTGRAGLGREPIGAPLPSFGGNRDTTRFAEAVASGEASVEALLLYYANPIASSTNPSVWREALEKIPFVVSFSPFPDETASYVDVILPDLLAYERWQDAPTPISYPYPVWGLAQPLVEPPAGAAHAGDTVLALARSLGGSVSDSLPHESFLELLRERARGLFSVRHGMTLGNEFERRHHRQMEERGWWLAEHADFESFWEELIERGGWTDLFYDETDPLRLSQTDSGRIELMPAELLRHLDEEQPPRGLYVDVADDEEANSEGFPLRLIPYRVSTLASGTLGLERWLVEQPAIFPEVHWVPWIEVAPETAGALGFGDDTMVWVVSSRGRYRARLKLSLGTAPETVCAPYGPRHPDGEPANPLQLLDDTHDELTGLPAWSSTFVRLERA